MERASSPIAYRETIGCSASGERKYIRYYDNRGHFGHVQLQLIPHPGELCSVTIDDACPLPEDSCRAARNALFQRFDRGRHGYLPPEMLEREFIDVLNDSGYSLLAIDAEDALRAGRLSGEHRDPFDRMLAAQALTRDIPLLSSDAKLDAFGVRRIW